MSILKLLVNVGKVTAKAGLATGAVVYPLAVKGAKSLGKYGQYEIAEGDKAIQVAKKEVAVSYTKASDKCNAANIDFNKAFAKLA